MFSKFHPESRRLEPLGAPNDADEEKLPKTGVEEERDLLQSSLFALTTQFAQVQFRLRQIINAPLEEKEDLLRSLEEFSLKGVAVDNSVYEKKLLDTIKSKRDEQDGLVSQLKQKITSFKRCEDEFDVLVFKIQTMESIESQLRTQISDLERFIEYLKNSRVKCSCKRKINILQQMILDISSFFRFIAMVYCGRRRNFCATRKTRNFRHWGDLRAKLELAVINLKELSSLKSRDKRTITLAVRRDLATSIKDLMEHGTKPSNHLALISCFDCSSINPTQTHSWDIILTYYNLKNGDKFNASAIQKLSQSFNIGVGRVSPEKNKKNLLCAIGDIIDTHSRFKRSNDSHFKAFVCAALNANRLVTWLNLIFHCESIIETHYYPWSYVANTRYEDSLKSLEILSGCKFDLPVDFDVQRFRIEDNVVLY